MKIRLSLTMLLAIGATACDDAVAPEEPRDPPPTRDRGVLAPPDDAAVMMRDATVDDDDGVPLLDVDVPPPAEDGGVPPEPDAARPPPDGPCTMGETRLCEDTCGVATCVDGAFGPCQPAVELCNDHDDNCNGDIDEGYAGLGNGCVVDRDGCSAQGVQVCSADGRSTFCDAPDLMPSPEVCDGDDDDCDGRVDEDFPGRVCCSDDLQCGPGERCMDGECQGGVGPGPDPDPPPGGQCIDDFDCDLFEVCVVGECRPFCLTDLDCPAGQSCDPNLLACVEVGPECVVDGDCFGFEVCQNGSCVPPPPPPCMGDDDCPGLQECQDGVCVRPPGVGSCDGVIPMDAPGQYRANTEGAFDDIGAGCGAADNGPEQVFSFTVEGPARVTLDTNGSAFDTVLTVETACGLGPELACNDDGGDGTASLVELDAMPGVEYFAVVHGYDDADVGDVVINYALVEICIADADCGVDEACVDGQCRPPVGQISCNAAIEMDAFGRYNADTANAADEFNAGCGAADNGNEQVFTFSVDEPTRVRLDTTGSAFDTVLSLMLACGQGDEIDCDDDGGDGNASLIEFDAMPGVEYFAIVHGYNNAASGAVVLEYGGVAVCLGNADCAEGENCIDGECRPSVCGGGAIAMDGFGNYMGSNVGAEDQSDASCGGVNEGPEQVFSFQLDAATDVVLDSGGTAFDTVMSVRTVCDDPATELVCDDDGSDQGLASRVEFRAEAGVEYYVIVEGYDGLDTGDIVLAFGGDVAPPPPAGCDGCLGECANGVCVDAIPAACAGATVADALPAVYNGSTVGLANQHQPPCGLAGDAPDDILLVAFPVDTRVTASTAGSDFDTVLYVLEACGADIICNDDFGFGTQSEVSFDATAGVPYYIVVDGYNANAGDFTLTIDLN